MVDADRLRQATATSRIRIRPVEARDAPLRALWLNDPINQQNLSFDWPVGEEATLQWIRRVVSDPSRRDFIVERCSDDRPIGWTGLVGIDHRVGKAEFYMGVGEPTARRQGFAQEVFGLATRFAFLELGLRRLTLTHVAGNEAIRHLALKQGWTQEGLLRQDRWHHGTAVDQFVYGLLRSEWVDDAN